MTKEELEKENAELKTKKIPQLERRIASIRGSHRVDVKKLNARTEQVERLKKENAELEAEVKEWKDKAELWCKTANLKDYNIMINKELEKENAEQKEELKKWKDEWQEQVQKATDEGYARTLQTIQLTKAKELLKDITSSYGSTEVSEAQLYLKIKKAEQFISEVEK